MATLQCRCSDFGKTWGLLTCPCPRLHFSPRPPHASVTDINTVQHDKWPWKQISAISSTSLEPFPQALAFITVWFPQFYFGRLCLCPWCKEKCWISTQDKQHRTALAEIQPHSHNLHTTWRICQPSVLHVLPYTKSAIVTPGALKAVSLTH